MSPLKDFTGWTTNVGAIPVDVPTPPNAAGWVTLGECPLLVLKNGTREADAFPVSIRRGWDESPRALALRTRYRCERCHKGCLIPCRFTAAEFRQMEQGGSEATPDVGPIASEST